MAQERTKLSAVEAMKAESRGLRGTLAAELADTTAPFSEEAYQLLKFHGSYQGFDRDTATARKQQGLSKEYQLMVRAKIPGGRLTAAQYLALDALADPYADGSLRITTRQGIQFHGIVKGDLKATVRGINDALLTTLGACGDVVRNVVTHPAPIADAVHRRLEADAKAVSARFGWKSRAYHEIWLDGEPLPLDQDGAEEEDAVYGRTYLPRKFKIGLATPADNSIDVLTNDLAVIALFDGDQLQGYNLALGGGLGQTHNRADTFPRLATPIAFVGPDDLIRGIEAVIAVHREHGNRNDRKRARLKYVVEDKGATWVKAELDRFFGAPLEDARPTPAFQVPDHMGWHPQGDGRWYLGLPVSSGRIKDTETVRLRTALREVIAQFAIDPVLTPEQDILLSNIADDDRSRVEAVLRAHGVALAEDLPPLALTTLACPALPTCGLALAEAERVRDPFVAAIHDELASRGLGAERLSLRITGCPNGCARPSTAEIGLVGRTPGHYAIYVGGAVEGTRLNDKLLERVPQDAVPPTLGRLFGLWAAERQGREGFGDFALRVGLDRLKAAAEAAPAAAE
ncbi:NADPH-dependent assimilatory sulfite reductase hemoprotein subunit [Caenispirillum bisanense]|uniref:Sulfite reductase (NADPH) beta subunit n=1 Tax=Caenispirillum bisanense TaxID=414052 RepID=A0A286GMU5_9PROT|nr:NADPH-dependent assimilatory sulfite reductase hemoprotein subunit [Caenispirillum bisanense]SOD96863.1 sulfite reductase (NADPH) beta subunit [Caenispirillum bisanense]